MPIQITCSNCSKTLKAPDSAAGKRAKCPGCGNLIDIPAGVFEAEEMEEEAAPEDEFDQGDMDFSDVDDSEGATVARRKPCPKCGESIVASAAKCRYCGEVFDRTLARSRRVRRASDEVDTEMIRKFRREMHGLGGFWIFIGSLAFIIGIALLFVDDVGNQEMDMAILLPILIGMGLLWLVLGVFTCLKHMWAVWVGLVLSYLSIPGNLIKLNICGLAIMAAVIIQAHRVISAARKMNAAGVPLTEKP